MFMYQGSGEYWIYKYEYEYFVWSCVRVRVRVLRSTLQALSEYFPN